MKEEDLLKEAHETEKELKQEIEKDQKEISILSSPLWYIVGIFLALIIILAIFPPWAIKADPEPRNIPKLSEVVPSFDLNDYNHTGRRDDLIRFMQPSNDIVKQVADSIVTRSCSEPANTCYAKAIYYSVRDSFQYISDPPDEYVKHPLETLKNPVGDCDDNAVLLANLLEAVGYKTRFVTIPNHVFIEVYLEDAKNRYKESDGWIALDATCKNCDFASIPESDRKYQWNYIG